MKTIEVHVGRGVFVLSLWPTLITLCMLVVLLGLGAWQVKRLHWKENLIAAIAERTQEEPIDVDLYQNIVEAEFRPAKATGLLQHDREFYLNGISLTGLGGYHILTPMRLDDGRYLLVDRGWVPYDKKLPETRPDGQLFGPVTIVGLLHMPQHHWMQPANDPAKNDWYGIDLSVMAKIAGVPGFLPYVLTADTKPNPGGLPIGGQARIILTNNHLSYALTWFSLAVALLVIYGVSSYRKVS